MRACYFRSQLSPWKCVGVSIAVAGLGGCSPQATQQAAQQVQQVAADTQHNVKVVATQASTDIKNGTAAVKANQTLVKGLQTDKMQWDQIKAKTAANIVTAEKDLGLPPAQQKAKLEQARHDAAVQWQKLKQKVLAAAAKAQAKTQK